MSSSSPPPESSYGGLQEESIPVVVENMPSRFAECRFSIRRDVIVTDMLEVSEDRLVRLIRILGEKCGHTSWPLSTNTREAEAAGSQA